jgi:dienelactone hydrolase
MRFFNSLKLLAAVLLLVFSATAGAAPAGTRIDFSSLDASQPYKVSGTLYFPAKAANPTPAVVIVHGTTGIDMRGAFYREALLNAGIAVFEVDFKTGIYTSAMDRPKNETFLPMAFAALKELRKLPAIDPHRIAIMGFSMGGGITVRTAIEANRAQWMGEEKGFAAHAAFYHAAFYPVCKPILERVEHSSGMTGAPIIIFYGTEDAYGEGKAVPELKSLLRKKFNFDLATVEYPGATHGFNRNAPALSYADPAARDGRGYMEWNPAAANDSLTKVVEFLRQNLGVK